MSLEEPLALQCTTLHLYPELFISLLQSPKQINTKTVLTISLSSTCCQHYTALALYYTSAANPRGATWNTAEKQSGEESLRDDDSCPDKLTLKNPAR